jgi:hypothetical protein
MSASAERETGRHGRPKPGHVLGLGLVLGATALMAAGCSQKPAAATTVAVKSNPRDWTGVWRKTEGLVFDPKTATDPATDTGKPGGHAIFGVGPDARESVPYNAKYQAVYEKTLKDRHNLIDDDYISNCVPYGFPRIVGGSPGPVEFIVTPKEVWIIDQYFQQIRRIYMDVPHKPANERWPTFYGDSVGRWDGDTLVVDTVGSKAGYYDRTGAPYSDQTHSVERIRKLDDNTIEDQITIEDPVMLTKPWVVTRQYKKQPASMRMQEFYCTLNRNPIVIGKDGKPHQSVVLPGDKIPGLE